MKQKKSGISRTVRRIFAEEYRKRLEGVDTPSGIHCITDVVYGDDPTWQSLDIYIPEGNEDDLLPVIVNVHGGGWVYGTKEDYRLYCMGLASGGFKVVNFTYRLCPEFRIPDGPLPKAMALNSGIYLMEEEGSSDPMTLALMREMLPNGGTDGERELVNLPRHINGDFPPVILMTCEGDFAAKHSRRLLGALEEKGVSCQLDYYGDSEHVLEHAFEKLNSAFS